MTHVNRNELRRELLGPSGLNPFVQNTSSSRGQMFAAAHLGQMLVVEGSTHRTIFTGMEREYAKRTFCVEMPEDGQILAVIPRYAQTLGSDIAHNPETLVIYESENTKELNYFSIVDYCTNHPYFGFRFRRTPAMSLIRVGNYIEGGTKFLVSPSVAEDGDYKYGIQTNVMYGTHPAVAEDGVVISESYRSKLAFKTYATRVIQWGSDKFPLNLYGTVNKPKFFPDIGETIRDDGILMALRRYDPVELTPLTMLPKHMMNPRVDFDEMIYAEGGGGVVVDVKIDHSSLDRSAPSPFNLDAQAIKYDNGRRAFYQAIVNCYEDIRRKKHGAPKITPKFSALLVKALSVLNDNQTPRISFQHRRSPLDVFRAEITIEYRVLPNIGFKLTDCHGGKGVVCKILPDEHMPVDKEGNRAEVIMDSNATINRANAGRLYEQYLGASAQKATLNMCKELNITPGTKKAVAEDLISGLPQAQIGKVMEKVMEFYTITNPAVGERLGSKGLDETQASFLATLVEHGIRIYFPPDNQAILPDVLKKLEKDPFFKPPFGPVTYVGNSGRQVTTRDPIRIGPVYVILLEKTGEDWGAVSGSRLQHHGLLAPLTRGDKYNNPARLQTVRGTGEAEIRIVTAYCGPEASAELMDRNNSPKTHEIMVDKILRAEKPSNVENLVDRNVQPYGTAQPNVIVDHLLFCAGVRFAYQNHTPAWDKLGSEQKITFTMEDSGDQDD